VSAAVLVLYAHPRPELSRVNQAMAEAVRELDRVTVRDLYALYPDYEIDVGAEQKLLSEADLLVLHHPLQWYSGPPILKEWIDRVLERGWAYGHGGTALRGKRVLSAVSTGGKLEAYQREGFHGYTVSDFLRPYVRTATLCGIGLPCRKWSKPRVRIGPLLNGEWDAASAIYGRADHREAA